MLLTDVVVENHPELEGYEITHIPLCDIFTLAVKGTLIGYFDPIQNKIMIDKPTVERVTS